MNYNYFPGVDDYKNDINKAQLKNLYLIE